jgi:hypothetical protein
MDLKIKHTIKDSFYIERISDSEYASDKVTSISVYGYTIYSCVAPIAWKSKTGKSVTTSSTEAEYVASPEIAKEAIFVKNILDSIGIKIELPIKIRVDNIGAIYLANNYSTNQRTKHIDIMMQTFEPRICLKNDSIYKQKRMWKKSRN